MDFTSAELANTIVGNVPGAPVMECHLVAPRIRFESDATICLTGANMNWHIDNLRVERNRTISIAKGSVLDGSTAVTGSRGYIAIRGEIETSHSFGSASTYTPAGLGGNHGRSLTREDRLQWIKSDSEPFPIHVEIESVAKSPEFELEPGPEFDWMEKESIVALCDNEFRITSQSDRMGARLDGPTLSLGGKRLADSVPLLPGMVQLTPDGKCIVVLQDGQTTGGYPRIGYLDESAVERLNQTKIGQSFRFRITDSR
jgi:antagonist of KipI